VRQFRKEKHENSMGYHQHQTYDQEALKEGPRRARQGWSRHQAALRAATALVTLALLWRLHALHRASGGGGGGGAAWQAAGEETAEEAPTPSPPTTLGPTFLVLGQMKSGTSALWK
jgi:hypothetical protein